MVGIVLRWFSDKIVLYQGFKDIYMVGFEFFVFVVDKRVMYFEVELLVMIKYFLLSSKNKEVLFKWDRKGKEFLF